MFFNMVLSMTSGSYTASWNHDFKVFAVKLKHLVRYMITKGFDHEVFVDCAIRFSGAGRLSFGAQ